MILSFHHPFLLCFRWSSVDLSRFRSFLLVIFGQSSVSVLSYQSVLGTDLVSWTLNYHRCNSFGSSLIPLHDSMPFSSDSSSRMDQEWVQSDPVWWKPRSYCQRRFHYNLLCVVVFLEHRSFTRSPPVLIIRIILSFHRFWTNIEFIGGSSLTIVGQDLLIVAFPVWLDRSSLPTDSFLSVVRKYDSRSSSLPYCSVPAFLLLQLQYLSFDHVLFFRLILDAVSGGSIENKCFPVAAYPSGITAPGLGHSIFFLGPLFISGFRSILLSQTSLFILFAREVRSHPVFSSNYRHFWWIRLNNR